MVGLDGKKMSKSRGNLVFVSSFASPGSTRWLSGSRCWLNHYRDDWDWHDATDCGEERLSRWREAVRLDAGLNADEVLVQVRSALA